VNRKTKLALGSVAALLVLTPSSALAATTDVDGTISAGTLDVSTTATPSFSATLDGTDQTKSYSVPTTVTDARGNGSGWHLTITSTQFADGAKTLAANASTLTGVTNECADGATCTNPDNAVTYPVGVPAGPEAPAAVKYFSAAESTGLGKFENTPSVDVFLPADVEAGSYTSTLTVSAVSGP
jgi:X-X-X-Leu-X-X-Gly heptad repeat protein